MNEKDIEKRFEQNEEALKQYKIQLDTLKDDLKLLIEHSNAAQNSIVAYSMQTPHGRFTAAEIARCKKFVAKYGISLS